MLILMSTWYRTTWHLHHYLNCCHISKIIEISLFCLTEFITLLSLLTTSNGNSSLTYGRISTDGNFFSVNNTNSSNFNYNCNFHCLISNSLPTERFESSLLIPTDALYATRRGQELKKGGKEEGEK